MKYKNVVFDVDGTLINSEQMILKSLQKALLEEGIKKTTNDLKFVLGIPGKIALSRLLIKNSVVIGEKWNEYMLDFSNETTIFSGIIEVLDTLQSNGIKLGIITSKTKKEYEDDFMKFNLHKYFDLVICADDTKKHKPDGEPMEKYLKIMNIKKEDTIYIGDSVYDMQCAKNAEVDFALALWGAYEADKIDSIYKLENPKDILNIL